MSERVPTFDAVTPGQPAPRAPLPPETPVESFERGIVFCELPTRYRMGSTNCWLVIGDEEVLCVDPGDDPGVAAESIGAALAAYRRRVEDIETILVTHTHPDHCAAAAGLAEIADAVVAVGAPEVERLAGRFDPPSVVEAAWRGLGAPPDEVRKARQGKLAFTPVPNHRIRPLYDGNQLKAGGRVWDVHVVGGHSPGHVVLAVDGLLVAGDQLLANVLPAPHFGPALPAQDGLRARGQNGLPWAPSIAALLGSMDRFDRGFEQTTVLPGHGAAFRGTARPVERVRRYHRIRCDLVGARLSTRGPTTVWELALEMYAGLVSAEGIDRRFASAAAEVAGRLEALHQAGRATRAERDGTIVFAPA